MRSAYLALLAFLLTTSSAFGQAGSAGFQILRFGYSARDLSLATSADAVSAEPVSIFTNPAGLAFGEDVPGIGFDVMLTHRTYVAGTTIDMFGTRFKSGSMSFGTSLLLSNVPDIQVRTVPGDPQATFSAKDFALAAGAASSFGRLDLGISAMYLYEKLFIYESSGYAFNAGAQYRVSEGFILGLAAGNLGSSSAMISDKIVLPAFLRAGGSYVYNLEDNLSVTGFAGLVTYKSGGFSPSIGAELDYSHVLRLRVGYASETNVNFTSGYSFGAGVHYGFLSLDYSYVPMTLNFGDSQTFTLSFQL